MKPTINSEAELIHYCKQNHKTLFAVANLRDGGLGGLKSCHVESFSDTSISHLYFAKQTDSPTWDDPTGKTGWFDDPAPHITVDSQLLGKLHDSVDREDSELRRASTFTINRTFVYLDISDFSSAHPSGHQILILNDLAKLISTLTFGPDFAFQRLKQGTVIEIVESMLCVGDGYVIVCRNTHDAIILASTLATKIEELGAKKVIVPFSFRIGIHVGPVNCFWDIGRKDWNYMGEGIIGSRRVLDAIGKDVDNVLFVSDEVKQAILCGERKMARRDEFLQTLSNRGRRYDKHRKPWRVHELDHMKLTPPGS